ncbi:DinB family protein [Saxibacter everestensis]|uniref:DinB family protein n=1 Tax=Saxibacter everestensis TaxID=2909229 RepID=A0ABY8QTF7_9MICO|nr:DinB family protein [Brevibacteriaceae bacterium ZFBP1038]
MNRELRAQFDSYLDEYRSALHDSLNGLTEEEARLSLVPSRTTLLGLVKHAIFVEGVWFDEAITGRSRKEIGLASTPDGSFILKKHDTIASLQAAYRDACEASRRAVDALELEETVEGRGPRPLWRVYLHMVRELAQHCGHADILREQVLARRTA